MAQVTIGSILPVGTVLHSMLSVAQFQAQYGTNWVLADGSSCTGTKYASVTGATTLPDMRGRFLRGKSHASGNNPDGDLALGTYTADRTGPHNHQQRVRLGTSSVDASVPSGAGFGPVYTSNYTEVNESASGPLNTKNNTGTETAPRSITVNIFIRIN